MYKILQAPIRIKAIWKWQHRNQSSHKVRTHPGYFANNRYFETFNESINCSHEKKTFLLLMNVSSSTAAQ